MIDLYTRRRWTNRLTMGAAALATLFGLFWLAWLLFTLCVNGIGHLSWSVFSQPTPSPKGEGGLYNAIIGSLIVTGLGTAIGAPIGILAGTYLAEYGRDSRLAAVVRFFNDVLLAAPSIVLGLFIYQLVVVQIGHFAAFAGGVALALIVIPVTLRLTENMMRLVPDRMREAAAALGVPRWKVITHIVYRAAKAGIATGVLLGVARIAGETAPLLFTALNNRFTSYDLWSPIANLPIMIFRFALSPYEGWNQLAWVGAFLITFAILGLNIFTRVVLRHSASE
ncbi:phosphate ABC transporter permease PstA [Salinisphaera sp. USBA-960]|uniref:phosphate ABC transporter permease PstA n=1 Tax=Salinisphaera orenii TaxID=856731 RepID=UPI000DBE893F|nr:phosphate ABC transporter permease PstA [Salifodinibacter halophilus]NNC26560.1 phosphate ABC transporter permease PstA [Salifodinibacter halophilus]